MVTGEVVVEVFRVLLCLLGGEEVVVRTWFRKVMIIVVSGRVISISVLFKAVI